MVLVHILRQIMCDLCLQTPHQKWRQQHPKPLLAYQVKGPLCAPQLCSLLQHFSKSLNIRLQEPSPTLLYVRQHFRTTLFSNTSLQHFSTTRHPNTANNSQKDFSPTLFSNTSLQHFSSTMLFSNTSLLSPKFRIANIFIGEGGDGHMEDAIAKKTA